MSKYTTELRYLINYLSGNDRNMSISEQIEIGTPLLFNFTYPIFNENYRPVLEKKIVRHYFFNEIGQETTAKFQFFLENKMNEIMPYYNKLYESDLLKYDPLHDVDITEIYSGNYDKNVNNENNSSSNSTTNLQNETSGNSTSTSTSTSNDTQSSNGTTLNSDLPQYTINLADKNNIYGSTSNQTENSSSGNSSINNEGSDRNSSNSQSSSNNNTNVNASDTSNEDGRNQYKKVIKGKNSGKNYSEMLLDLRNTFINIDMMVIEDLRELFMLIY